MNTPETDKRVWSDHSEGILYQVVEASFARRLERERDEAREERDIAKLEFEEISNDLSDARNKIWRLEKQIEGLNNFANERYEEIQKVHKERDEAIRQLDETTRSSKYSCDYNYEQKLKAERERDEAREDLEFRRGLYKVQEEYLEEAREKAERYRIEANALMLQRDEARNLACVYQHQYYMHVHPNAAVPYFSWEKGQNK